MPERVFVDTNIAVYASGGAHAMRDPSRAILVLLGSNPGWGWSSSEVLQEILYYYLRRGQRGQALQVMERFDEVLANRVE